MEQYIQRKDKARVNVLTKYTIQGFISSGTYGKVYKACSRRASNSKEYAIKKFKAERENEVASYVGLSLSACREMSLCQELKHDNIVLLEEIFLEEKCIYMVFEFYEYDLLQVINYHLHQPKTRQKVPDSVVRGILHQLLQGVSYLHENWVMHRDLKPANIMITKDGIVKIGDLGLARLFHNPIQPLYTGDKVVVTIWYRAPELLLGSKHYGPAIDLWAIGCIFAELLVLRPLFKGDEIKVESKKNIPFQRHQMLKIIEILGTPSIENWPGVENMPDYMQMKTLRASQYNNQLAKWYGLIGPMASTQQGLRLLLDLLEYNPARRRTAKDALTHAFFSELPRISSNVFSDQTLVYPDRQIKVEDSDMNKLRTGKDSSLANSAQSIRLMKGSTDTQSKSGNANPAKRALENGAAHSAAKRAR